MAEKKKKGRYFATIVYPESAPANWIQVLKDFHVAAYVSPLHDVDTYDEPGKEGFKKDHYHVMVIWPNTVVPDAVKPIFDAIGGVGLELVVNGRGYARYLCHLDDDDKMRYEVDEVMTLSDAIDYKLFIRNAQDENNDLVDILTFIDENGMHSFRTICLTVAREHPEWLPALKENAYLICSFSRM